MVGRSCIRVGVRGRCDALRKDVTARVVAAGARSTRAAPSVVYEYAASAASAPNPIHQLHLGHQVSRLNLGYQRRRYTLQVYIPGVSWAGTRDQYGIYIYQIDRAPAQLRARLFHHACARDLLLLVRAVRGAWSAWYALPPVKRHVMAVLCALFRMSGILSGHLCMRSTSQAMSFSRCPAQLTATVSSCAMRSPSGGLRPSH